jgi:hypothetical protein
MSSVLPREAEFQQYLAHQVQRVLQGQESNLRLSASA